MSSGFPGIPGAPMRSPNFQIFKTSGNFIVPQAQNFIVDVFGGGGSGASSTGCAAGGGGGARHRTMIPALLVKAGMTIQVIVGAGGATVTGGLGAGNTGGKSSFGSPTIGFLIEAYGGGGGGVIVGGGGGGIAGAGTSGGLGGFPNFRVSVGAIASLGWNASGDYGGANTDMTGTGYSAIWGGGAGSSTNMGTSAGASLYAGGGGAGGWSQWRGGKSGAYFGVATANTVDGISHALMGAAGSGGTCAQSPGLNGCDGGFPSGGGGGTDSGTSGKGGDGLVVIYWW